ncbi:MAG: ABC transporter ATP-binding protein [Planctomycetota bacterium]|jgi:branched-chain amino acid transport system ATP-binding protein|nr:ABC transporter ATP-binding protein [Planctomycetota bacterium]
MSHYFETNGIVVKYDRVLAVRNVSIHMNEGETISLIGSNGAGKTSTLRAITGLAPIVSGEIRFAGGRIDGLPTDAIVKLGITMVPEGRHVFPLMTVRDNLLMGAFLRRDRAKISDSLDRVVALFPRLKERFHQAAGTMSGGEQQMMVIGRGLMADPKLLVMDEPSLGVAPKFVQEIARAIIDINKQGVSVILVEQNSRMALRVSRHAYVMSTGSVVVNDQSARLLLDDRVQKAYLGEISETRLAGNAAGEKAGKPGNA